jgi:hypothetical protein
LTLGQRLRGSCTHGALTTAPGPRRSGPPAGPGGDGDLAGGAPACPGVFTALGYRLFCDLMTGWVLAPGRRTITRVLTLADPEGRRAHDACHRFVRAGRWATGKLWRALAIRAARLTRPDGAAGLLAGDTLAHKSGRTLIRA